MATWTLSVAANLRLPTTSWARLPRRHPPGRDYKVRVSACSCSSRLSALLTQHIGSSPQRDEPPRKKAEKSTTAPSSALVETTARSRSVEDRGRGWNKGVGERIAVLADQLEVLKRAVGAANAEPPAPSEDISARLAKLEDEMASLRAEVAVANSRLLEIAEQLSDETLANLRYEIMADVETRLAETKDDVIEETEDKIEERFLTVKEDLREAVEEEVENAEERIKEQLSSGMTAVYFEFPR